MHNEQRLTRRKVLKVKAQLTMEGEETIPARTIDVGGEGLCLAAPIALKAGAIGIVRFEIFYEGKSVPIAARSRVQYCILSNDEYKIGLKFVKLELSAMASLSKFLH